MVVAYFVLDSEWNISKTNGKKILIHKRTYIVRLYKFIVSTKLKSKAKSNQCQNRVAQEVIVNKQEYFSSLKLALAFFHPV